MKNLKSNAIVFFLILLSLFPQTLKSQDNKTVNITAIGNGATQNEATQVALRSAIEQTFGVFISSKTEIFNDNLLADEIASVANGNIQSYKILNQSQLADGNWSVTLNAIISISKLTSFVQSKGVSVEIKGGLFAINIKQQILNEKAEKKAIEDMIFVMKDILQTAFDYKMTVSEPISNNNKWNVSVRVNKFSNNNFKIFEELFNKSLAGISLKPDEVEIYKSLNKRVFIVNGCYLRNESSLDALYDFQFWLPYYSSLYEIKSGEYTYSSTHPSYNYNRFEHKNEVYGTKSNKMTFDYSNTFSPDNYTFSYTLEQIEALTEFSVKPLGKVLKFEHGGIFVPTEKGDGFILSYIGTNPESLRSAWANANLYCENLDLNGFSDWRLPTKNELEWIFYRFGILNIPFMFPDVNTQEYVVWSSTKCGDIGHYAEFMNSRKSYCYEHNNGDINAYILAVRNYQKTINNSTKLNVTSYNNLSIDEISNNSDNSGCFYTYFFNDNLFLLISHNEKDEIKNVYRFKSNEKLEIYQLSQVNWEKMLIYSIDNINTGFENVRIGNKGITEEYKLILKKNPDILEKSPLKRYVSATLTNSNARLNEEWKLMAY